MTLEIKQAAVSLSSGDLMELEIIMTDEDREEAFQFLKKRIYNKIATSQGNRLKCHLDGHSDPVSSFKEDKK